jgi:vacuolar-type H+-ATPase subunit E/Vma4
MTLEQCVDLPVRDDYDLFPEEKLGTVAEKAAYTQYVLQEPAEADRDIADDWLSMEDDVVETEAEKAAYTQYVLAKLAETDKKIADGKAVWISNKEVFARIDALIEAWESQ